MAAPPDPRDSDAAARDPAAAQRRFDAGNAAFAQGDWVLATAHYRAVTEAQPAWPEPWVNLAHASLASGDASAAAVAAREAVRLRPGYTKALAVLARALEARGDAHDEVLAIRSRLVEAEPASVAMRYLLGLAQRNVGRYPECRASLDAVIARDPRHLSACWVRGLTPPNMFPATEGDSAQFLADFDALLAHFETLDFDEPELRRQLPDTLAIQTSFYLGYVEGDIRPRQRRYAALVQRMARAAFGAHELKDSHVASTRKRLRVGFVSAYVRRHAVQKLFKGFLTGLPRERFETIVFAVDGPFDDLTAAVESEVDRLARGLDGASAWAKAIRESDCDVLVYLDLGMHPRPFTLAALRLAPKQVMLWGHPMTSGLDTIDAVFVGSAMVPESAPPEWTEPVIRLSGLGCWCDPAQFLEPATLPPVRAGRISLVCTQNASKLTPAHDGLFARIMAADPRLELRLMTALPDHLLPSFAARMRAAFSAAGVAFDGRVTLHGYLPEPVYLAYLRAADLGLDAIGWSAGVTAFEGFHANLPAVTVPGNTLRGRQCSAMLEQLGLEELIAADADDYVARVTALCRDDARRRELRQRIAQRKAVLYRDDRVLAEFADRLEALARSAPS